MTEARDVRVRGIGVRSAAGLVAANMIGAGVFTTSGFALADLGRPELVVLAWAVGGVIALCGALSYARLAERIPGNGGEYLFLSRTFHPFVGFLAGWVSLLAGFTAPIAVAAHGLEAYVGASFGVVLPPGLLGASAIVLAGLAHGITRDSGLHIQDFAVAAKLIAIIGFIVLGAFLIGPAPVEPIASFSTAAPASLPAFAVTLVWISFAYSGWNAAVYVAGELDRPAKTLPRALVLATLGVTLLYLGLNAVFVYAAPIEALAGKAEVGAIAAEALGGAGARVVLSAIVALALWTSISAMVMVGPRVYAQMAADGVFPARIALGSETPRVAIGMQVALALAAFFLGSLRDLLLYTGFLLGISAAATVACLFLRGDRGDRGGSELAGMHRAPIAAPSVLIPAALFIFATLGSAGFMIAREPVEAAAGAGTLVVGAVVYFVAVRVRVRAP